MRYHIEFDIDVNAKDKRLCTKQCPHLVEYAASWGNMCAFFWMVLHVRATGQSERCSDCMRLDEDNESQSLRRLFSRAQEPGGMRKEPTR
jgi:hypothetical protein